ncbi:hypothetical protein C8J56DRAFT_772831, partial [Mycena floridula]
VDGYKSLISPIRKFPPEIIRQIFEHFCTENRLDKAGINIPALVLSRVYSH